MVPRVSIRRINGTNGVLASNDLDNSSYWSRTSNLIVAATAPGTAPPFGTSHLAVTTGTPGLWEHFEQTRTAEQNDRYVFWGLFYEYVGAGAATTYLLAQDTTVGTSSQQFAAFAWSGGVPSVSSTQGIEAAGVVDMGNGWYAFWIAADVEGYNGVKGNDFSFRVYASGGDSTAGKGVYCAHLQVELGLGSTGPRTAAAQVDGPWAAVQTTTEVFERGGRPGELFTVESRDETTVSINPITTKRERRFGVVESQSWQAKITNLNRVLSDEELSGAWACIEAGFQASDEWAVVGQGQIERPRANGDLTIELDVVSPMKEMIQGTLQRWVFFDDVAAHASTIETVSRDDASDAYDNDASGAGVTIDASTYVVESRYVIEFLTATTYQVTRQSDGTVYDNSGAGWAIGSDNQIDALSHTVQSEGWTGTYSAGDQFEYTLAEKRSSANAITPVALLIEFLTSADFLGLQAFNVRDGYYYESPLYDQTNMWDAAISNYTSTQCKGEWQADDKIVDLVQGILKIIHASIYTMPNGQLGLWETQPNSSSSVFLNGNMESGVQHLLDVSSEGDFRDVYNVVRYKYNHLEDGSSAELIRRDDASALNPDRTFTVDVGKWRCDNVSIETAASKALSRVKAPRRAYSLRATPAGAVISMNEPVSFEDAVLGIAQTAVLRETSLDVVANVVRLLVSTDPVILADHAVVGTAYTDPVGSTVGGTDTVF